LLTEFLGKNLDHEKHGYGVICYYFAFYFSFTFDELAENQEIVAITVGVSEFILDFL